MVSTKGFKPDDPLFPMTKVHNIGSDSTQVIPKFYASEQMLRNVIKKIFKEKGFNNVTPHKIRHLLMGLEGDEYTTKNQRRAFYLNMGHSTPKASEENYALPTSKQLNRYIRDIKFENLQKNIEKYNKNNGKDELWSQI